MKKSFCKNSITFLTICFLHILCVFSYSNAGTVENVDGYKMYKLNSEEYAKDSWCFVDFNGDLIKECYRFDEEGHIAKNYISEDGRATNEKGQLIENGFVVEKMPNGKIRYGEGEPYVNIKGTKRYVYKSPTDNKQYPDASNENEGVIKTVGTGEELVGPVAEGISNEVVYAGDAVVSMIEVSSSDVNTNTNKQNKVVAGKNIVSFIDKKTKCKIDKDNCTIYGGIVWDDCIELSGTGAIVSFDLKNNNYMYFEVAEEPHVVDEKDINIVLEVYVDNELVDSMDEFVEGEAQEFSEELYNAKKVELRVKSNIVTSRRIYIHNGKFKRVKEKDE